MFISFSDFLFVFFSVFFCSKTRKKAMALQISVQKVSTPEWLSVFGTQSSKKQLSRWIINKRNRDVFRFCSKAFSHFFRFQSVCCLCSYTFVFQSSFVLYYFHCSFALLKTVLPTLTLTNRKPGVNFINVLQAAFTHILKVLKIVSSCQSFFALSGSARIKAAPRTLIKLTPFETCFERM